uniref:26S proteasome regulatory subunit RPN2 C-terminal domain-containing protein n=1 Tax=Strigamia maritima TaxID=126957 RepID=T1J564_STRMM
MALGIACAGTGLKEAIALLEPVTNDPVNYVRQGALIASALILIQQTEATCPKVKDFRQLYTKVINDKHDDVMAKFGAILAQGIIDAGGRNVTISFQSRTGHTNMTSVVGMLVFTQHWFWFPLAHFLALSFTPTSLITLNSDLKMPKIEFRSNAKPSTYGYPAAYDEKRDDTKEKEKEKGDGKVKEKDSKEKLLVTKEGTSSKKDLSSKDKKKDEETKEKTKEEDKEPEANFEMLSNPARVMKQQLKVMQIAEGCRYIPMKDITIGGIIMTKDLKHEDPEDIVEVLPAGGPKMEDEGDEPEPPEPFEYIED